MKYVYQRKPDPFGYVFTIKVEWEDDAIECAREVCAWCEDQFGPQALTVGGWTAASEPMWRLHGWGAVAFDDAAKAMVFRMRWC